MQQRVKKIVQRLSKEYGITEKQGEMAVNCYYEKIKEVLEAGNYPEAETFKKILIPCFGRFIPNENKIKRVYERARENRLREQLSLPREDRDSTLPGI